MKWLIFLTLVTSAFAADETQTSGVQVQGSCNIKVVPDRGSVSFTTETQSKDQKQAVNESNQQINSLKEKIQKLKLADMELKTTNYSVFPVREYEKEKLVDKGMRVSMTLELTTSEIARLGEAMLEASKVGIKNVGSMSTFLSQEKNRTEYLKCLDIASDDARKKAQQLGNKLNFKVGDVVYLIESPATYSTPPQPMRGMMMKSMMADSAPASVEAGSQNFSATIQVLFAIK